MKKRILILFLILSCSAWAQVNTALTPAPRFQFISGNGLPLAGGCLFSFTTGTSTPLATYTDATGTVTNANPVILDANGSANVWLGPQKYRLQLFTAGGIACSSGSQIWQVDGVSGNNIQNNTAITLTAQTAPACVATQYILWADSGSSRWRFCNNGVIDTIVGQATTDTLTNKTLTAPVITGAGTSTFTGSATFNGTTTFNGAATFSSTAGLNGGGNFTGTFTGNPTFSGTPVFSGTPSFTGGLTGTTAGVFTNTQMNLFIQSILNSCSPTTEFTTIQGGLGDTEGITGCIVAPSSGTVHQAAAVAGYMNVQSAGTTAGVGGFFATRCLTNNVRCWASNMVVTDNPGGLTTGAALIGNEIDCDPWSVSTAYGGIVCFQAVMNAGAAATGNMPATAFQAITSSPNFQKWANAFQANDNTTWRSAVDLGAACTTGTCNSQLLLFGDYNSGTRNTQNLVADNLGNLIFTGAGIRSANALTTTVIQTPGTSIPQVGETSQKTETGTADANVLTVTPPAVAGTYRACFIASVSSATAGVISWTLSWTDSNGNAQSNIAQGLFQDGTAAPATSFTTSAAGNYHMCRELDVNNAAASIIVKWVGGGTTAAKVTAVIERLI